MQLNNGIPFNFWGALEVSVSHSSVDLDGELLTSDLPHGHICLAVLNVSCTSLHSAVLNIVKRMKFRLGDLGFSIVCGSALP